MTASILGVVAPGILLASGSAARIGRSAQKRAVARAIIARQIETFRQAGRASTLADAQTTTTVVSPKLGSFTVLTEVDETGALASCEVTVTWRDTRGSGVITDSLQMGTIVRQGS